MSLAMTKVLEAYSFPFKPYDFQMAAAGELEDYPWTGIWADPGTGKTLMASMLALEKGWEGVVKSILVLVPPILVPQWSKWFSRLGVEVVLPYQGSPKARKAMDLAGADVVVMSYQIFKKDFVRVTDEFRHKSIFIICDEAAAIRNIRTQTYKAVRDLCRMPNKMFTLLSGTPVGNPVHGYAYISLINPTIYRDFRQFMTIHVTSVDIFKQPNGFAHLDLLKENLMRQAVRIRADDVLQLPPIQFVPVEYDLDPKHKRLYDRLVEEKLLVLEDEEVLDGTVAQRLYHSCQRLILKAANGEKPQAFSLIDLMLDELDIPLSGEKLIVFCNYQDSNKEIYSHLQQISGIGAVQAYGGLSPAASRRNLQRFLEDPAIHVLVGNPKTVGEGVDNCQSVSRAILFLELPLTGNVFQQCIARVYREGQKKHCVIKMAIANGTIQQKLQKSIISKEDVVQKVMPTKQTLRAALYGA